MNQELNILKFKEVLVNDIMTVLKAECEKINKGINLSGKVFRRFNVRDVKKR